MTKNEIKNWQEINKNLYSCDNYLRFKEIYDFILKEVGKGKKVCDLGCGDGSLGERIKRNNNEVFGADIVEKQLQVAQKKGVVTFRADLNHDSLQINEKSFDVIIATEVIEHLLNPDNLLDEAYRLLKDDGIFIVTTPNLASLGRRIYLLCGKNPVIEVSPEVDQAAGHIRYFVKESLYWILKRHRLMPLKFNSDVVHFDKSGRFKSHLLAKLVPGFGRTLICVCKKEK